MPTLYPGLYRAEVAAADDPEERARHRVRVFHVHDDSIPAEHLPWAELAAHAGRGWGDIPHYEVGDLVWVMFEGGDRDFPVILAGWLTAPSGVSDLPAEQTGEYSEDRRRWTRIDRVGNLIEMSEKDDEKHIRFKSGGVEIIIKQTDDSLAITVAGPAQISAKSAVVTVENDMTATVGGKATIDATDDATVKSAGKVIIEAGAGSEVTIDPLCKVKGGGGNVQTDVTIPACLFAGAPFPGNPNLQVGV